MRIENTFIAGLKVIHLNSFTDTRGSFVKVFNKEYFENNNLDTNCEESYFSISNKNVIRGMHFQVQPYAHTKLVYVNKGELLDVVLDIRKESPTFGKPFSININCAKPVLLHIPVGCAHGFLSLQNNTIVTYLQTTCYHRESDQGIRYDSFGFDWEIENPILSDRDKSFDSFQNFKSPF